MSEAFLDKFVDLQKQIDDLRVIVATQDKTIKGMKHYLKVAADYQNEDPAKTTAAIQAALGKASVYHKTPRFRGKR